MISEELLKQAAEEAAQAMPETLPTVEIDHAFSSEFKEKMQKLRKKTERPKVYTFLKHAACAVLALALLCGTLMLNRDVRASVMIWIRESFARVNSYSAKGEGTHLVGLEYRIKQFPQRFELYDEQISGDMHNWTYIDSERDFMHFGYILNSNSANLHVFTDDCERIAASVNGYSADVYLSQKEGDYNSIVWSNSEGVLFHLSGPFDMDELILMAESVYSVEK